MSGLVLVPNTQSGRLQHHEKKVPIWPTESAHVGLLCVCVQSRHLFILLIRVQVRVHVTSVSEHDDHVRIFIQYETSVFLVQPRPEQTTACAALLRGNRNFIFVIKVNRTLVKSLISLYLVRTLVCTYCFEAERYASWPSPSWFF